METAYVLVSCDHGSEEAVIEDLKHIESVREVNGTFGAYDIVAKIENLNSDKKRNWFLELKSLNNKTRCDSAAIPADIVSDLISNEEIDWFDDEGYEPESNL